MYIQSHRALYFFCLSAFTLNVSAQEDQNDDFGFIGLSGAFGESVFSNDQKGSFSVEPNLFYNGEYGFIDGSLVNVSVLPYVGLTGHWRFAEVDSQFDDIPNGIQDRDGNGELGITLGSVGARLTYLHDVTDEHNGYEVQLHLGKTLPLPFDAFSLTPYFEVDYRDKKLSRHLYSVSNVESLNSNLKQFDADDTWVYQTGLIGLYDISSQWMILTKLEFEHHDSSSPLIQNDLGWSFSLGISYKFTD